MRTGSLIFIIFVYHLGPCTPLKDRVDSVYKWVNLEYDYPTARARQSAIDNGTFIPGSPRLTDVDVYYNENRARIVFVTSPRLVPGVPVTLGTVTNRLYNGEQIIAPFPSWDWHTNWESCPENRMVSVFRIQIDECQRLWVLDTGSDQGVQICPAQVLAFDLKTNALVHRYEIPFDQIQQGSILNNPMVDVRKTDTCQGTFVYISDTRGFAIIVYDVDNRQSWKVTDKTFHATPDFGRMCVPGAYFDVMDGILGMALSPYVQGQDRVLFYHSLASNSEQWVWTSHLRNRSSFITTSNPNPDIFNVYCGRRDTQASPMAIDQRGISYFGLLYHTSLNCWNTNNPYGKYHIKELYNSPDIQYITGLKIVTVRDELWFSNTRVARIASGPTNEIITNFWIHKANLQDFVKDCCRESDHYYENQGRCHTDMCSTCVNGIF
ncbi:hypothetical protein RI129_009334 [Pyrocoelia pectoralis]|uniref:Uncharacterized protein n=1 Tax=Pyrocoelia pectoralis TaxID=417401 RepID=A0AAN7ZES9_9COLE